MEREIMKTVFAELEELRQQMSRITRLLSEKEKKEIREYRENIYKAKRPEVYNYHFQTK